MLNPNDVANKKFEKYMGKGYRQEEVDSFLRQLAGDITAIMEEKQALERKMEVLAEKLMEYKNDEDSLRAALIGAQKLGDTVIRESKDKAARIVDDANARASSIVQEAQRKLEKDQLAFSRLQHEVASFKSRLQMLYKQHLEMISSIPDDETAASRAAVPPAPVDARQRDREYDRRSMQEETPAEEQNYYEEQPTDQSDSQEFDAVGYDNVGYLSGDENTDRIAQTAEMPELEYEEEQQERGKPSVGKYESRFGTLKFGSQYNIKREDEKRKK